MTPTSIRLSARVWAALIGLLLLGLALRLVNLGSSPLRGDEAFAIQYWAAPWPDALALAGKEPHPLGTFALFMAWKRVFGDGEWVMRLLPALLSLPGATALFVLARKCFKHTHPALLATLLYAVHPFLIWHAQDARNYAIWTSTELIALAALLAALNSRRWAAWLRYALSVTLSAYVFFFAAVFWPAHALITLWRPAARRRWLLSMSLAAVLLVPWFYQLALLAGSGYGGTAGGFVLSDLLTSFLPALLIGETLPGPLMASLWLLFLPVLVGSLLLIARHRRITALRLALCVAVPVAVLSLIALRMDIFRPRYVVPVAGILILILSGALWVVVTTRSQLVRAAGWIGLAGILALYGWTTLNYQTDPAYRKAPNWRTLGGFLTTHVGPEDYLIQQALDPGFTYYFRGEAAETTLPSSPDMPEEDIVTILRNILATHRAIWLVPAELPGFGNAEVPLTWLQAEAQPTARLQIAGFDVFEFQPWRVETTEFEPVDAATFGDLARLSGWRIDRLGDDLRVILYWLPLKRSDAPISGFVHLVGPAHDLGSIWAQDDHALRDRWADTTAWETGQIVRDVYQFGLPADLPSASWSLHLGLYDPVTAQRLPLADRADDYLEIPLTAGQLAAS